MPLQEATNTSAGRLIHIDAAMILPGETVKLDAERLKSKPVKAMVDANELKLGAIVNDDGEEDGEDAAPAKSPAPKPAAASAPAPAAKGQ